MRRLPIALLALGSLAGCVANDDGSAARTPWGKVERVLAIDFSPAAAHASSDSFRRVFDLPHEEALRAQTIVDHVECTPALVTRHVASMPAQIDRGLRAELARGLDLARAGPTLHEILPPPDHFATTSAANLATLGRTLWLDRRPLGEIHDREHRTDPRDDRPEATIWARLRRRIFP